MGVRIDKYVLIGLSIIFIIGLFGFFSDESNIDYDFDGFVYDVRSTEKGYVFDFESEDLTIRCYYHQMPEEYGHYSIKGNYSDDETIFFIEYMISRDL